MQNKVLCEKSIPQRADFIIGEVMLALFVVTAAVLCFALPIEKEVEYIRYIFGAIAVLFLIFLVLAAVAHYKFERLPVVMLETDGQDRIFDVFDNVRIDVKDIDDVKVVHKKNKYGKVYPYGKIEIVTARQTYKIPYATDIDEAKAYIMSLKEDAER